MNIAKYLRTASLEHLLWLLLEVGVKNPITSFLTVTFSTYGSVCLEFLRTVFCKTILKKINRQVFVNMNFLVFSLVIGFIA